MTRTHRDLIYKTAGTALLPDTTLYTHTEAPRPEQSSVIPIDTDPNGETCQSLLNPPEIAASTAPLHPPPTTAPLELNPDATVAQQQRDSPDLGDIIRYLETGVLPPDTHTSRFIVHDADN